MVRCAHPVLGYISVWALIQAITANGESADQQHSSTASQPVHAYGTGPQQPTNSRAPSQQIAHVKPITLPAPNADELFGSVPLAKAAHEILGIGQGAAFNYRLDPWFFEKHPELYDNEANIIAHGVRLRPDSKIVQQPYPEPRSLDSVVVSQYRKSLCI